MTQAVHDWFLQTRDAVGKWSVHNFPDSDICKVALGLGEESGEAQRAVLKRAQQIRGTYDEWTKELGKELSDVLIKVFEVAAREDMNLFDLFVARWENDVSQRDLRKNPLGHGLPET